MYILSPACVISIDIPLVKRSHMAKPKIKRQGNMFCLQRSHGKSVDAEGMKNQGQQFNLPYFLSPRIPDA